MNLYAMLSIVLLKELPGILKKRAAACLIMRKRNIGVPKFAFCPVLLLALFSALNARAQQGVLIGGNIGGTISHISVGEAGGYAREHESFFSLAFCGFARVNFSDNLGLQLDAGVNGVGYRYEDDSSFTVSTSLGMFSLPLTFQATLLDESLFRPRLFCGGFVGFVYSANQTRNLENLDASPYFNSALFGFTGGLGLDLALEPLIMSAEFRFSAAGDVYSSKAADAPGFPSEGSLQFVTIQLGAAYLFGN